MNGVAKRQVDDVDAKLALVRRHEFDGADHVTGVACAVVIQDLERNEPRLRCNAPIALSGRQIPSARDQPRHVGAVAVTVCGRRSDPASSEIVEAGDPVTELGPRFQTGVDHRNTHAIAGVIPATDTKCSS